MTRDHCLCESSWCHIRTHMVTLYSRSEGRKKQNKTTCSLIYIKSSLSAVSDNDAGCGYVSSESNKNRCGPDTYFALGGKRNTVASTDAQLETLQVWQVHSVKTDGCFSNGGALFGCAPLHTYTEKKKYSLEL